jgi:Polyketide cyclase / dehydrase and lipid transport
MSTRHALNSVELEFFQSARYRVTHRSRIQCSANRMMEALLDNAQWAQWAGPIKRADWTSPPGVANCTRDVFLVGGIVFREIFFHWEDHKRVAFSVYEANVPGISKFAEEHTITVIDPGQVQLDLTVALEPTRGGQIIMPIVYPALKVLVPVMVARYKKLLES